MGKSVIKIEKDKIKMNTEETEISHNKEKISVSAPSITIQESGK